MLRVMLARTAGFRGSTVTTQVIRHVLFVQVLEHLFRTETALPTECVPIEPKIDFSIASIPALPLE